MLHEKKVERFLMEFFTTLLAIIFVCTVGTGIAYGVLAFVWWTWWMPWFPFTLRAVLAALVLICIMHEINKWAKG